MFPFNGHEESGPQPLTDEDHQLLTSLVQKYGHSSIVYALTGYGESSRASIFSANTLLSSGGASLSAPSLAWTSSDASQCRSDGASISTQHTWPEVVADMPPMHDAETGKLAERSWLDSPAPVPSPMIAEGASHPSPRLIAPTGKKYQCPMCYLDSSPVGFGRKSDFKKHLHNFHGSDIVWICHTKGCYQSFSTERAYSTHAKEAHRMKALPNSTARTDLCPQVVFSCGFETCRDRVFEAASAEDASATRDKHFEHIAKHFEDDFDVSDWEYKVQIQNLLRQQQVKPVWKTCIWPKEKRQQLQWRARSSGDLRRMLEARHLGSDISQIVRLAFILGNAPFSAPGAAPPGELDSYFQLPYRHLCPDDAPTQCASPPGIKGEEDSSSTFSFSKYRSSTQTVFRLSGRNSKRASRPPTPTPVTEMAPDTDMAEDSGAAGPHPGTPYQIPSETVWHDAPKFAPEQQPAMHKPLEQPMESPMIYPLQGQDQAYATWTTMDTPMAQPMDGMHHHHHHQMDEMQMHYHAQAQAQQHHNQHPQLGSNGSIYGGYAVNASPTSTVVRPGTPTPHKRPGSWSRVMSMESLRPSKKMSAQDMGGMMPTSMGGM
ncbi:Zinc C2H2 [Cordyceps militaris]|uniref:Zinc C2H2 n=1 Tax=Cordyceps militaris TaxID=73501 RepID=A0A2H4SRC2_CORMI|nr:Zinc C2H2 [Cordyceps militaris]